MSSDNPIMYLRIPPELREVIREQAAQNQRSLTAEIIFRVIRSYRADGILGNDTSPQRSKPNG